jgi:hypothetical protein
MPKGPPPGLKNEDEDSDDDIPMPEGPPPGPPSLGTVPPLPALCNIKDIPTRRIDNTAARSSSAVTTTPANFYRSTSTSPSWPSSPGYTLLSYCTPIANTCFTQNILSPFGYPSGAPPPPPGFFQGTVPPPPPGKPYSSLHGPILHTFPDFPPPGFPPPPPGFFPKRNQSSSSIQDPLSSIPHKTFQSHRELPPNPMRSPAGLPDSASLPQKPIADKSGAKLSAATVSAAPQLRDLKKEATAFVPTALKRKRPGASGSTSAKIDAAPSLGDVEDSETIVTARPDLLSTLHDRFGPVPTATGPSNKKRKIDAEKNDDYEKFVEDVLGTAK